MAVAIGRNFNFQPCSPFKSKTIFIHKPSPGITYLWLHPAAGARVANGRSRQICAAEQQRATWLPGLDPPSYLDGTLAGDFGFDPLGLGEDPESLRWYVQAELVHCRFAMLGVLGILVTDVSQTYIVVNYMFIPRFQKLRHFWTMQLLRVTGLSKIPVWFEAGAAKYDIANTQTLLVVQLILMGFVETKRYMDFVSPGSQGKASFFGIEDSFEGLEPGYPGGPILNPLGLAKDIKNAHDWKLKEIKNGRLAMVAMLGIFVQASVTHVGPIDNLVEHLSNPWHKTIIQTLANS
nr:photosystem I chlorophyll a/b-binding protein 5, chloroplastic isoform X1 [Arachis hypogaea]